MHYPPRAHIMEVGPRDGFQAEKAWIPTERKIEIINALSRTGLPEIQVTSFVHPKAIPQLADADEVLSRIDIVQGVSYRALTPNLRGIQRALAFKDRLNSVSVMLSVTESHNRANGNRSIAETFAEIGAMFPAARDGGLTMVGSMICAFGCPFEGRISIASLEAVVERYLEIGVRLISLADTIGIANPRLIRDVLTHLQAKYPEVEWSLHLHNTRGMALANTLAALQAGVSRFDGGVGGLGGCPYAPGATGNIATEDLVNMLAEIGVETGVDLDRLLDVADLQRGYMPHAANSAMIKVGKRRPLLVPPGRQDKIGVGAV
jgi:hydroxymethylglutaryl-CoA lyase